jgi:hypothetical protein
MTNGKGKHFLPIFRGCLFGEDRLIWFYQALLETERQATEAAKSEDAKAEQRKEELIKNFEGTEKKIEQLQYVVQRYNLDNHKSLFINPYVYVMSLPAKTYLALSFVMHRNINIKYYST